MDERIVFNDFYDNQYNYYYPELVGGLVGDLGEGNIEEDPLFLGEMGWETASTTGTETEFDYHLQSPEGYFRDAVGGYIYGDEEAGYSPGIDAGMPAMEILEIKEEDFHIDGTVRPYISVLVVDEVRDVNVGDEVILRRYENVVSFEEIYKVDGITLPNRLKVTNIPDIGRYGPIPVLQSFIGGYVLTQLTDFGIETEFNGRRVNIGAYGGTVESSLSMSFQIPAGEINLNAHPDFDSGIYPDDNMKDYDNPDTGVLTYWVGRGGANSQWCIEINLGEERMLDTLEIDWYAAYEPSDFDILDMSEEGFATLGTNGSCDGEIILEGLSEQRSTNPPFIPASVIDLNGLTTNKLGIRINEVVYSIPAISEIRVMSWD